MGMYTFKGEQPTKSESLIAKNYMNEKELTVLNRLISAFFDLAELHAINHEHMYMKDWLPQVDDFAQRYGKGILHGAGTVKNVTAIEKATEEYKKYSKSIKEVPTKVEIDYFNSLIEKKREIEGK